jgi:hypothetical protein
LLHGGASRFSVKIGIYLLWWRLGSISGCKTITNRSGVPKLVEKVPEIVAGPSGKEQKQAVKQYEIALAKTQTRNKIMIFIGITV